ncbi:PREDICTED: RING finger protein 186 [Apaloderma vittatum]|uniref:RING finger protein 186 n=1 Tax=Apaloderma vittatum TaxID=57397 RepID=UPI000521575D|nr:PREDICTED: RING finger protein 186 [Apaloderma vittatum]
MEKSSDELNPENRATAPGAGKDGPAPPAEDAAEMSRAGPPRENAADAERLELAEELTKEMESPSGAERDSPDASKLTVSEGDCPNSVPLVTLTTSDPPDACSFEMNHPCPATVTVDLDCLVCFNKYNIYRVPKLLDCQHAFCAVCLKLILRKEETTWIITCPLCRKATPVSGGLIRTLRNKEDVMEHLENPDSHPEVHISAAGLDSSSWTPTHQEALYREENVPADNRLAVQRLVLLLLLVVILTILILPFMYSGLIKWVICLVLTLGLLMSMVLCCTPKFYWRCNRDSLTSCHKQTHIVAIA